MASVFNNDDAIWLKHIQADTHTLALLNKVVAGTVLMLEIDGTCGNWMRMADGRDGRPTLGFRPVGSTLAFWKTMKNRRNEYLDFRVINPPETYLTSLQETLSEWHSQEDELAFNDL